jgi:DNA adenine methylase
MTILTSPLKWAGGKRWLLPVLTDIVGKVPGRLVEPFVGGLSVSLGFCPQDALLNDFNPYLINFYRCLQVGLENIIPMANDPDFFLSYRSDFNRLPEPVGIPDDQQALLFYYLNRTGFNGLCRFNESGEFNVPFGKYKTINYARDFLAYQDLLATWTFTCGDFGNIDLLPTDTVYADPPYDNAFTKYSQRDFIWADQERLAHWLDQHPGRIVVSNHATDRILNLYEGLGFYVKMIEAPRRIASNGDRQPVLEMLATRGF